MTETQTLTEREDETCTDANGSPEPNIVATASAQQDACNAYSYDLWEGSTNMYLYQYFLEDDDVDRTDLIDVLTAMLIIIIQVVVYISLFTSVYKRYEADDVIVEIPYRQFVVVTFFMLSFLWSDIYKSMLLFQRSNKGVDRFAVGVTTTIISLDEEEYSSFNLERSNKGSRRTSVVILSEALIALAVGVTTTIISLDEEEYSSFNLVINVVGILFVHDIDEQIFEMYDKLKTRKERIRFVISFMIATFSAAFFMWAIRKALTT
eukprot:CAMPEP_0197078002 /NCGR_PEP_ID=MMETSP1384-20130603/212903_1 /TAXON_ID=29189 /ORGANISM="Ammonia sp." /LENGTH=263 /DNA_ID=CAMNT_0042516867 /DNA_START=38 /DNA_END=830 /DNA_ORIENTATION=+